MLAAAALWPLLFIFRLGHAKNAIFRRRVVIAREVPLARY
jgi:hypothetical protein